MSVGRADAPYSDVLRSNRKSVRFCICSIAFFILCYPGEWLDCPFQQRFANFLNIHSKDIENTFTYQYNVNCEQQKIIYIYITHIIYILYIYNFFYIFIAL